MNLRRSIDPSAKGGNITRNVRMAALTAAAATLLEACTVGTSSSPSPVPTVSSSTHEATKPPVDPGVEYLTKESRSTALNILSDLGNRKIGKLVTDKVKGGVLLNNFTAADSSYPNTIPNIGVVSNDASVSSPKLYFTESVSEPGTDSLTEASVEFTMTGTTAQELTADASRGELPTITRLKEIVESGRGLTFQDGLAQISEVPDLKRGTYYAVMPNGQLGSTADYGTAFKAVPPAHELVLTAEFAGNLLAAQAESHGYLA